MILLCLPASFLAFLSARFCLRFLAATFLVCLPPLSLFPISAPRPATEVAAIPNCRTLCPIATHTEKERPWGFPAGIRLKGPSGPLVREGYRWTSSVCDKVLGTGTRRLWGGCCELRTVTCTISAHPVVAAFPPG